MIIAELIIAALRRAGVTRIFGVPGGGSNLHVMEAARASGLPFVRCHRESAACIMAAATGELTGRPGVALVGLGPGVTASATGLAHARLDRAPMLLIADRYPDEALAYVTHQRLDHAAHLAPVVKGSVTIGAGSGSHWVAHAIQLALAEPRGPVHLDLPADVGGQPGLPAATSVSPPALPAPLPAALDRAADLIAAARRPVVVAGLQCRPADARWLRAFCEALPAPVLTTHKAKGALPDPHPLCLGAFTGGATEEALVRRADLIIAFGLDPVELLPRPWPYAAPVVSLTRGPGGEGEFSAPAGTGRIRPAAEVVGDLGGILDELAPRLLRGTAIDWDVAEVDRLRRQRRAALEASGPGLAPHRVVQAVREATPAGTIATVDAGAHVLPTTACWDATEPGELLISNGLSAMGFALPAAIAAQLLHPARRVICFTGAGGLLVAAAELETLARLGLPVVVIAFDPAVLSGAGAEQERERGGLAAGGVRGAVDLPALARSFGLQAWAASSEGALRAALGAALAAAGPALIAARLEASTRRRVLEVATGTPAPRPS